MPHIVFNDEAVYEDFEEVNVELKLIGGWLYIETQLERISINEREMRFDGTPMNILDYAINQHPDELVTIFDLIDARITARANLRQVMVNAGIKGLVRDYFLIECSRDAIRFRPKVVVKPAEAEALIDLLFA